MADAATKHFSTNGRAVLPDLKTFPSLLKTRRSLAFVYGFMFAFVVFTAFLTFNSSLNWSSPLFVNIFSITNSSSSTTATTSDSYGSHFSPVFSYFFPNNNIATSSSQQSHALSSENSTHRSNNTTSEPVLTHKAVPSVKNKTKSAENFAESAVLHKNSTRSSPNVNKELANSNSQTQTKQSSDKGESLKLNQTATRAPRVSVAVNQSVNSPAKSGPLGKDNLGKVDKGVAQERLKENYTASFSKKQSNETKQTNGASSQVPEKRKIETWMQNLTNCNLFDGEWVMDDSYPLYKPGSCSLIDEQFNCIRNGRPDNDYQKYKWKPYGCNLPRLNAVHMLDLLKGKRLVFVGDSLNRNMWESLVCILKGAVKDQKKVYEANGRNYFRGEASYSFVFKDYDFTIEFFVSPFLVQEWEMLDKNGTKKETLRLDLVGRFSEQYRNADIIIFNTGHWWTHDKTSLGKDYYQEGSHVYKELNVLEAFRKALTTWGRWIDANINPMKSLVFFRGYSESHFSGGQWNSGGACDSEVRPIKNVTYLREYEPKMKVLEKVLRGMKTHVTYLNVTRMTDYRKDGHPSIYRKQNLSKEERRSSLLYQDCSHWCLPGVPDTWNEILYTQLLINENRKRHR
ncbi:hypothetical protein K2173_005644 [Erythroxylum novogranatense]|uniref:Trichome birefringence-like N-terminal domain-containing protein n=1 Tax=Erythroxylum novogranatense TaxID=1862640 RepID=A0AAV8SQL0_9ROSI|nr:hypothetical protein K2173_005644 [Erythroxylum novogranatense]